MLFMSKHRSAPSSDFLRAALIRLKRSCRRRSRFTRSSQSTPIRPKVLSPIADLLKYHYRQLSAGGGSQDRCNRVWIRCTVDTLETPRLVHRSFDPPPAVRHEQGGLPSKPKAIVL